MSILIAYKKGNTIFMGTDTRLIINERKTDRLCECDYKIQKMNGGLLVGISGDRITRQTIFAYSEIFTFDKRNHLTRRHIAKEIIPKLIDILKNNNLIVNKENKLPYMNTEILLAYQGELYGICSSFTIYKYQNFQATGSASEFAQFTIVNANDLDDANEIIIKALDVVSKNSQLVGSPYVLIDTKEQKFQIIRKGNI